MKSIVQAGIVIILAVLCIPMVPAQSVSEYSPSGKITGWGGLAIDYDIQGLKITEFEDKSVLRGYPTGSKVTIIFKVSGPYSIEGNWATDFFISLNGKEIEKVRAPYQGGAPGWSYSPKPIEIDITDDIKKNGFTLSADVGYARSEDAEGVSLRVVGLKATESSTEGNAVTGILEPISQTITKFWETISESDCNLKIDIKTEEEQKSCNFLVKVVDKNSENPIPGANLEISIIDQQTSTKKRTLEATTDGNGEYRWTENWEPNDLGKTYLAEVSATKDECSPDDTSTLVTVPLTAIVGDVLEIVLNQPPVTPGYVWICPEEIDDVSNLNECWPPSAPFWTTWDEDGKFELLDYRNYHQTNDYPILQKGRYRVWAWASGYLPTNVLVDVKEEKTAQANLRLATSLRRLDFHLVDGNNAPIKNAEVSLSLPGAGAAGKISSKTNDQGMTWLQLQGTLFPCKLTTYDLEVIDPNTGATIATGTLDTSIPYCSGPLDFGKTNNLIGALSWDTIKAKNNSSIIKIKGNATAAPISVSSPYNGQITRKAFHFSDWGYYKAIETQGRTYFTGYDSGYLNEYSRAKTLPNDQAALVLKDIGTEEKSQITITSENPLKLAEGYQLAIKSIDTNSNKAYLELSKNGEVVDSKVIAPSKIGAAMDDKTYYYKAVLGRTKGIVQIAVHFINAFRGAGTNLAGIDGVFQLSDSPITL